MHSLSHRTRPKDLHTWCTLTLIMGLLALSTMAYGNNLQVEVATNQSLLRRSNPTHNHHFDDSNFDNPFPGFHVHPMFLQLQCVSGSLQPGFHRVSKMFAFVENVCPEISFVLRNLMSFCTVESLKRRPIKRFTSKSVLSTRAARGHSCQILDVAPTDGLPHF